MCGTRCSTLLPFIVALTVWVLAMTMSWTDRDAVWSCGSPGNHVAWTPLPCGKGRFGVSCLRMDRLAHGWYSQWYSPGGRSGASSGYQCTIVVKCQLVYRKMLHTCLTATFQGLPRWANTRRVKPVWILMKQETVSGSGISWAIWSTSLHTDNHMPHHSVFYRPDAAQPTTSKHWRYKMEVLIRTC